METPFFFKNKDYNLFGVLHEPDTNASNLQPFPFHTGNIGLVFCHAFAEEKLIAHRVMVNLARRLTKEGIYSFRFDYMGHGDSDGNFDDSTIETRLSDIQSAVDCLIRQPAIKKVGLLGVRFGATLAALACERLPLIEPLILISPIIHGKAYIDQCLRSNLTTQMALHKKIIKDRKALIGDLMAGHAVNIDGYLLTKKLYQQIEGLNLLTNPLTPPQRLLLLHVSRRENQPIGEEIKELFMKYKASTNEAEFMNVTEHHFWTDTRIYIPQVRNIQEAVTRWLLKEYSV